MQPARHTAPLLTLHTLNEIEQLVDNNLKYDWILRVEHSGDVNPVTTQWQQWGNAQFAVDDAKSLIDNILACRASHSTHTIRLRGEKLHPQTQLTYWIYRPQENTGSDYLLSADNRPVIADIREWLASQIKKLDVARQSVWRIVIVTGVLLASLLLLEESIA